MSEISGSVHNFDHNVIDSDNPPESTTQETFPHIISVPVVEKSDQDGVDEESKDVVVSTDTPRVESAARTSEHPEKIPSCNVDKDTRLISCARASTNGIAIRTQFRSSIALALNFAAAIVLTGLTIAVASTSFSRALIYNPPFLPYDPQSAILLLQVLATFALMTIQECFYSCSEIFRWSLAARGANFLSFLVLSPTMDFGGLLYVLIAKARNLFATWRMFALYKIFILYVVRLFGQFVWLLEIDVSTRYRITEKSPYQIGVPQSVDFSLSPDGIPVPFATLDMVEFLARGAGLFEGSVGSCSIPDAECAINILVPIVVYTQNDTSPSLQVTYSVPVTVTEFQSNTTLPSSLASLDPWAYCLNHTTPSGSYLGLCMGGEERSSMENSSVISAGWQYCHYCDGIEEAMLTFTVSMWITKASGNVITWMVNNSIAAIDGMKEPTPYSVNISQLFTAFSAPLWVNQTMPWSNNRLTLVQNVTNTTVAADDFVDSLSETLVSYGNYNEESARLLRILLSFALYNNPDWGAIVPQDFYLASQANALTISPVSLVGFIVVTALMLGCSLVMCMVYPKTLRPNISSFPELMFSGKLDEDMLRQFHGLSNGTDRRIIERFAEMRIKVGEDWREGRPRISISTSDIAPLSKNVKYE